MAVATNSDSKILDKISRSRDGLWNDNNIVVIFYVHTLVYIMIVGRSLNNHLQCRHASCARSPVIDADANRSETVHCYARFPPRRD